VQFITTLMGHFAAKPEAKVALDEVRRFERPYRLELERQPDNAYDINAIKVMLTPEGYEGEPYFIGHVAAPIAAQLAPYLDNDQDRRDNNGNPLWTEDHEPQVERCEIIDWVAGDKKPTIVIEVSTGYELGTLVKGDADGDGDDDFLVGDEGDERGED
jgi:hypothetical protein